MTETTEAMLKVWQDLGGIWQMACLVLVNQAAWCIGSISFFNVASVVRTGTNFLDREV